MGRQPQQIIRFYIYNVQRTQQQWQPPENAHLTLVCLRVLFCGGLPSPLYGVWGRYVAGLLLMIMSSIHQAKPVVANPPKNPQEECDTVSAHYPRRFVRRPGDEREDE